MATRMLGKYTREVLPEIQELGRTQVMDELVPVDVTPATTWFLTENDQDHYNVSRDFPVASLPWPITWMEYQSPNTILALGKRDRYPREVLRTHGALAWQQELLQSEQDDVLYRDPLLEFMNDMSVRKFKPVDKRAQEMSKHPRPPRWMVFFRMYVDMFGRYCEPWGLVGMYIDNTGQPVASSAITVAYSGARKEADILGTGEEGIGSSVATEIFPYLFALSLMHCKNVTIEDEIVPLKVRRARKRKRQPSIRYKTLQIQPMVKVVRESENDTGQSEIQRALHICRGHFKDYRDTGLFGKYHDIYWWNMHVRGSAKQGVVVKDYEVKPQRRNHELHTMQS